MRQILTILWLLLCFTMANAQGIITHPAPTRPVAPKVIPKKRSAAPAKKKTPAASARRPSKSVPAAPKPTIGTSSYIPQVRTYRVGGVTFEMVEVRGGTFMMGATSEQVSDTNRDEKPAHQVTLSSYYIGRTEVTQRLWQAVMGNNPSYYEGDKRPVEQVSWDDCQAFINRLNNLTGKRFRLPTEAEWEFAARGGVKSQGYKYSGSSYSGNVAWYCENSGGTTHNVATKQPNELGLYDMSGNVLEWCSDRYAPYSSDAQVNPTGPNIDSEHIFRGGSWSYRVSTCRTSYRSGGRSGYCSVFLGLRLCLSE